MSVQSGAPASLLQTQLDANTVLTTTGQSLPLSALYEPTEPVSEFPTPTANAMSLKSPEQWLVTMNTNVGPFQMKIHRAWSPNGADRFYSLVRNNFYDGARFFRYADNFVVQWGIRGTPSIDQMYQNGANVMDDPRRADIGNTKGRVVFATSGANTRSTQTSSEMSLMHLSCPAFPPCHALSYEGYSRKINAEYGEKADQNRIISQGNQLYLKKSFPHMSYITSESVKVLAE
ncbi:hypothetical protein T484DRAFT_1759246 [Baffinella frigidus]|nr:hypothetical protein T484DRAFT_1759246 [Cryptophyta sp. CCMP2293]